MSIAAIILAASLAGSPATAAFLCHDADSTKDFAVLLDSGISEYHAISAGSSLILRGKCVYIPGGVGVRFMEKAADVNGKHEVWKVTIDGDDLSTPWFIIHKIDESGA